MMQHKIVIANSGFAYSGKSTSIRYVYELLSSRYHPNIIEPKEGYNPNQDVKAIIEIPQSDGHIVKVGIESQGDPSSRQMESIDYFVKEKCEIILVACRVKGATKDKVLSLQPSDWQVIWFKNSIMKVDGANQSSTTPPLRTQDARLQERLSRDYAFYVASLIERLVLTEGII
ncbi:MAG: hypothetical protein U0L47_05225 [Paludibacteraceae bacterium]|nr:hypothetical protein [Paludibacteraceae bacterium]